LHAAVDQRASAPALLQNATTRIVYDLDRFRLTRGANPTDPTQWEPAYAATLFRETHASDPLPPAGLKIQIGFSYSDGFGREIQKKIQTRAGPVVAEGPSVDPRWIGSGWTIFNNKGKPVRQYEPFFSATHGYEFGVQVGVSPVLFYDPPERVIATLHPNHSYAKVGFDPWRQATYDGNDTVAPRGAQTGDPRDDPDIQGYVAAYFQALPADPAHPWQTWYQQRQAGGLGPVEQAAAAKAAAHADTPTIAHFDALGRAFLTVAHNRVVCANHPLDGTEDLFATRVELDIEGNQRAVRDAVEQAGDPLGRIVMRYAYDMLGHRILQASMEAGARWTLNDVGGKPLRAWDSRGHNFVTTYDVLRRPVAQLVRGTTADSDPRTLGADLQIDKIEYGESQPNAEELNLRTRVFRHSDSAGITTNARLDASSHPTEAYDFKGNLRCSTRRLIRDYAAIPDWSQNPALENETFATSTRHDALNRPIQSVVPHSDLARAKRNIIQPVFDETGLLQRVDVWLERAAEPAGLLDPAADAPTPVGVSNLVYDAKGQRQRIDYKNGVSTTYDYDPLTFRLVHLLTRRDATAFPGDDPEPPPPGWPGSQVQNLRYTYDPVGNIAHLQDDAQQTVYFKNQRVEPTSDYTYDALYRLLDATGREHLGLGGAPIPHSFDDAGRVGVLSADAAGRFSPNDGQAMGTYIERYVYDAVGNFVELQHRTSNPAHPGWTRSYVYGETSLIENGTAGTLLKTNNRLSQTVVGNGAATTERYASDAHGNLIRMPHLGGAYPQPNLRWDYRDQLQQTDLGGGGTAYYAYDTSGQRVRKVWEKSATLVEERIYLGGFELFRRHAGAIAANPPTLERETLHVMDDQRRIALVETRTLDAAGTDPAPGQLIRYQFGNHLGSACLELDDSAQIISYEEYAPYGSSVYQAVRSQTETPKRYRYTGMERDEESGLSYHGARYYAPWLGRWTIPDPTGIKEGVNGYAYVSANPLRLRDPSGKYGEAGHYYTVFVIALAAGFDAKTARTMANLAQAPDEIAELDAVVAGGKATLDDDHVRFNLQNNQDVSVLDLVQAHRSMGHAERIEAGLHSLTGRNTEDERAWRGRTLAAAKPGSLEHGLALHAFGDSFTHSYTPELGLTDDPGPNGWQTQFDPPVGHGGFGTRPDQIAERPNIYRRYVTSLFDILNKQAPAGAKKLDPKELDSLISAVASKTTEDEQIAVLREFAKTKLGVDLGDFRPEKHDKEQAKDLSNVPEDIKNLDINRAEEIGRHWAESRATPEMPANTGDFPVRRSTTRPRS